MAKLLHGVKVVELAGLAPVPYCGLVLADFGAHVTIVEKKDFAMVEQRLNRGKDTVSVDLKDPDDLKKIRDMCLSSDVLLDPFRPGVLEKLGLDPVKLLQENKKLVICRITGYGQTGRMSHVAGHDINYVSLSGIMPTVAGKVGTNPWPPANLLADFAGGGLTAAFGIVSALFARTHNGGEGCVIDVSMTEGVAYLASFINNYYDQPHMWSDKHAMFSGNCPFYRTFETKDGKHVAVGALEPKFNEALFEVLGIDRSSVYENPDRMIPQIEELFKQKTRDEWVEAFKGKDACVTPVLSIEEVGSFGQHVDRANFERHPQHANWIPKPAPRVLTLAQLLAERSKL